MGKAWPEGGKKKKEEKRGRGGRRAVQLFTK
jgi:hypothetical protein